MSAIIKGIKIPKYTGEHKEFDRYGGFLTVYKNGKVELHIFDIDYTIESIPTPHGRLIDAERLFNIFEPITSFPEDEQIMYVEAFLTAIKQAQTIIEAEVSE